MRACGDARIVYNGLFESSLFINMRIYQFDDNANDVGGDKDNADCLGLVQRHLYGAAA